MNNDPIRVQGHQHELTRRTEQGRPTGLDGCQLRLQTCTTDETYSDGYVDYVHEI